jgi:hypothetical protein
MTRFPLLALTLAVFLTASHAQDKTATPARPSPVREGKYACVFGFGGQFFDTNPLVIMPANKYQASGGTGAWTYSAAARQITFNSGILARDFTTASYVASGPVQGGLKKKKGPAIVLKPSAAYKKVHGDEAVPLYCYLDSQK